MDREKREAIAAFRFGVIYPLLDIEKGDSVVIETYPNGLWIQPDGGSDAE